VARVEFRMEFGQPRPARRRMGTDDTAYPALVVCRWDPDWEFVQEIVKKDEIPFLYQGTLDSEYLLAFPDDSGYVQMRPLHVAEEKLAVEYARDYLTTHVHRYMAERV
jgi:hypothetical protein